MDPVRSAAAPKVSTGSLPRFNERIIRTATPANPTRSAETRRGVRRCVRRKRISANAMNRGIVANTTAARPDGTRVSAQNRSP